MCTTDVFYVYGVYVSASTKVCVCVCACVCVYPDRQTELVDVRRGKRNTFRQTNKNRKKGKWEDKRTRGGKGGTDRGRKEILKTSVTEG